MPTGRGQKARKSRTAETSDLGERILDRTVALARDVGWDHVPRRIARPINRFAIGPPRAGPMKDSTRTS